MAAPPGQPMRRVRLGAPFRAESGRGAPAELLEAVAIVPLAMNRSTTVLTLLLSGVVAVLVLKTNFVFLAAKTLGLEPPEERTVGLYRAVLPWASEARTVAEGSVVVLGDSIAKGLDPARIEEDATVIAAGGMTTHVLRECAGLLAPLGRARVIVLNVGVNDLKYRKPEVVARDLLALVDALPPDAEILCLSMLGLDESKPGNLGRSFISNAEIDAVNELVEAGLEGHPRARFHDVREVTAPEDGATVYQEDGWHLASEGRRRLEDAIRRGL